MTQQKDTRAPRSADDRAMAPVHAGEKYDAALLMEDMGPLSLGELEGKLREIFPDSAFRWVRVGLDHAPDSESYQRAILSGWQPVDPDRLGVMPDILKTRHGSDVSVVRRTDAVLMHRPAEAEKRRYDRVQDQIATQTAAISRRTEGVNASSDTVGMMSLDYGFEKGHGRRVRPVSVQSD